MQRVLIVDNYDSFTYNLVHAVAKCTGAEPLVIHNDCETWDEIEFGACILSPGPGRPEHRRDFGICADILKRSRVPILGVCLGHQGICHVFGGRIVHAPEPMHGRTSAVLHDGSALFAGIPQGFVAMRYHSLMAAEPLPPELEKTAWTPDGIVMGVRHRSRPIWGVQFHPESVFTEHGERIVANFLRLAEIESSERERSAGRKPDGSAKALPHPKSIYAQPLPRAIDTAAVFETIARRSQHAFWLDTSLVEPGLARFSFLGASEEILRYNVAENQLTVEREGARTSVHEDIFEYLNRELAARAVAHADLPFDFQCGYVGYFGYELRHLCGSSVHRFSDLPDAIFLFADRLIVVDHLEGRTWLVALADADGAERWFKEVTSEATPVSRGSGADPVEWSLSMPRSQYLAAIEECKRLIGEGESYEICLTNEYRGRSDASALDAYRALRSRNPAPYSAFLKLGDFEVVCSSPERFLRIGSGGSVESQPIKGTSRRGCAAEEDARLLRELQAKGKNVAENAMIVDLVRHDLGRVCRRARSRRRRACR